MKPSVIAFYLAFLIGLFGCTKPVANWDESDIESWIKKEWALVKVTATNNGDGTFMASGENSAGTSFTFRVEKKPEVRELLCIRITGDDATPHGRAIKNY